MKPTNIAKDKLLYNLDRVQGEHKPITADVFLNNFCNNKCPYCTYRRWELDKDAKSMSYDDFVKYATRMMELGVRGIILTGGGEPTISEDFDPICAWMEACNIHYGINTNFNVMKYISPDYLKVSLDGWDEDSYEASRGVRKYAVVRDNIREYARFKKAMRINTALGVQSVITDPEQVIPFYEGNKDLPFDYMVLRPVESTGGEYYLDDENLRKAQKSLEIIKAIREKDERVVINFKWYLLDALPGDSCKAHWAQIALNEKGEVMYCCHKPYEIVGHIMDDDIMQKYEKAHTNIAKCDVPCRLTAPNLFMKDLENGRTDSMFI